MKRLPLYIDTDMGVDDIVALCLLIAKKFDIRGIGVVNGVSSRDKGVINLNRLLTFFRVSCPIFIGANQREQNSSIQFPALDRKRANTLALLPAIPLPKQGKNPILPLEAMAGKLRQEPSPTPIFAIGPLTNIAKLLMMPGVISNISSLTIMGGTLQAKGIVPPAYKTEYNVRLDPKAANAVFTSGVPITLVPLDATRLAPTKLSDTQGKTKTFLTRFYKELKDLRPTRPESIIAKTIILNNQRDFSNFYDPLAALILINNRIATEMVNAPLRVSAKKSSFGVVKKTTDNAPPIKVVKRIDAKRFYRSMIELLK